MPFDLDFASRSETPDRRPPSWCWPRGSREGGADNRHARADQWLFVVDGTGVAVINGRKIVLKPGRLLLIEAGDRHELRNTGRSLLKTVSIYVPPAYRGDGTELLAGRSR